MFNDTLLVNSSNQRTW